MSLVRNVSLEQTGREDISIGEVDRDRQTLYNIMISYPNMTSQYKKRMKRLHEAFGNKCVKCGSTNDLHFDHIDPSTKVGAIGDLATRNGFDKCYQEALKCQLLCKSCHIKKGVKNGDYVNSAKHHRLTFKDGTVIEVHSLDTWCREKGYHDGHLRSIRRGERKSHKGIIKVETL